MSTPIDVVVFKCRKFVRREIGEIVRDSPDLKTSAASHRAQNLPGPAPNYVLTLRQILSISVHFRRSYSRTRKDRFLSRRVFT